MKHECQVKHEIGCNGVAVRRYKGTKKTDPEFWCCLGCIVMLRRMGAYFKEVSPNAPKATLEKPIKIFL